MKIIEKIKKCFSTIGIFVITLSTRIFAASLEGIAPPQSLYAPEPLYGVSKPVPTPVTTVGNTIWNICRTFIIPIVLLIGLIIYFKKSKSSIKRKIVTTLIILVIVALLYLGINYLIKVVL